jgi:hypothetical protein
VNGYNLIYDPNIRITYSTNTGTMNFSIAILNLSNTSRAYNTSVEYSTDTPSLTLGEPNGLNEGVLEVINNETISNLIEAHSYTGNWEIWKTVGGTASYVAICSQNTSSLNSNSSLNVTKKTKSIMWI